MFLKSVFYLFIFNLLWLFTALPGLFGNSRDNFSHYFRRLDPPKNHKKTRRPPPHRI